MKYCEKYFKIAIDIQQYSSYRYGSFLLRQ